MDKVAVAAERIRSIVSACRWPYRQVARRAKVSTSTVRDFAGGADIRISSLAKIEAAIDSLDGLKAQSKARSNVQ